ncbi:phosphoethanolamine transferase [Vibrio sagamiensis]|uniref:Phosphoethanolamine transferase n=1 Tax=Vibrio sagamiensis NBRC 104589 TaxID=1219064 RepID=A0A511QFU4_9VIBR|nr:phosphoethanolamine--lipid A transferase [Vibrio sagamiensis]PNQ53995.1 phosphoethanolamine transferase [Vibrio agarivorans]GEM76184.1 phosphoethanolamine transferase [Vibrio sagamiensis NBRC 104589]
MIQIKFLPKGLSYIAFTALLALYYTLVVNIPVYKELVQILSAIDTVKIGFVITIPIFFFATLNFLFNLFSWPWLAKPFFILLLITSSLVSYGGYNYGTLFDTGMITNIVETDSSEASSYLSMYSVVWTVLMGIIPALLVFKVKLQPIGGQWLKFGLSKIISMLASLAVVAIIALLYYQDYASVGRNNSYLKKAIIPTQYVYSTYHFIKDTYFTTPEPYREIGLDAQQSPAALQQAKEKPTLLVIVVGETARSQNYQLNGYPRETNPYTSQFDIISFQDVASCGTATAVSVPCMFSQLNRSDFERNIADNQDNALDIMQRAGIDILWKENDGGDKNVAHKVKKTEIDRKRKDSLCNGNTCFDMALLENFDSDVSALKGNRVIALHLIGSHGPTYFQRYPKDKAFFQPDCPRADIENCSDEAIVNTYDNTIRYTDFILSQTIEKLQALDEYYNTAMIYVSDHGESLGEKGVFLHGLPYGLAPDFQKRVPLITWMSEGFQEAKNINNECLKQKAQMTDTHSHDNFFHSLLGLMDVETTARDGKMDIFSSCRQ